MRAAGTRGFLLLLPAGLSALVLGAHFLRRGELGWVVACVALLGLLLVRRRWAARLAQLALVAGALEWMRTLAELLPARRAAGEPWGRLAAILGGVALLALLGAALLETGRLRERYRGPADGPAPEAPAEPAARAIPRPPASRRPAAGASGAGAEADGAAAEAAEREAHPGGIRESREHIPLRRRARSRRRPGAHARRGPAASRATRPGRARPFISRA